MKKQEISEKISKIITIAQHAPSVHNSQPWLITAHDNVITVGIDHDKKLDQGDPTGRETFISLGIFCEAIKIAANSLGFEFTDEYFNKREATLMFSFKKKSNKELDALLGPLLKRSTDRSIYKPAKITAADMEKIKRSFRHKGVTIHVLNEKDYIDKIADLTAQGIGVALSSPQFREELSQYLVLPWSRKKRGISVLSLRIPRMIAFLEPVSIRIGLGLGMEVRLERRRWESASAIILITTRGDMQDDWFLAGKAYLRSALVAESLGLSQATSAATVEASSFHEDVENILHTTERLQSATRLGKGSSKKTPSPRVPARDLLVTSS